ncbi:MAG TPA: hypothetical protein DCE55_16090, partial [Planctomycetaceae bacterium]|nr:hypothetical protein [Planctomycetaceae bacterium]
PSGELLAIALRAMETQPADRYQTVAELQQAIRGYRSHHESLQLSIHAQAAHAAADADNDYEQYARAVFGFEEALKLWEDNTSAREGSVTARLDYALCAERQGDFELGLSLLDESVPEQRAVATRLSNARAERDSRQSRLRRMKQGLITAAGAIFVIVGAAALWINEARKETELQRVEAVAARDDAEAQRAAAVAAQQDAERQRQAALAAQAAAEAARDQEAEQRRRALENERLAQRERTKAVAEADRADREAVAARKAEQQATASAQTAREQTQLALSTLNTVVYKIQHGLEGIPGAGPLRRELLSTALENLEQIATDFTDQTAADRHAASTMRDLANVILQVGVGAGSQVGSGAPPSGSEFPTAIERAQSLYQRSFEIAQRLAQENPTDITAQHELAISLWTLGSVSRQKGKIEQAVDYYRQALESREQLAQQYPRNTQVLDNLAYAYDQLGDVRLQLGAAEAALECFRLGLASRQQVLQIDPDSLPAQRNLFVSYNKLGKASFNTGAIKAAQQYYTGA